MFVRISILFAWLWMASLLIATVGVSGQQIYCYCLGKTTFSIFSGTECCGIQQKSPTATCCAPVTKQLSHTCCEKGNDEASKKDCTRKTTKVFQLKTEFTLQEKTAEKIPALEFVQKMEPFVPPTFYHNFSSQVIKNQLFAHSPPPLSGRMICVRHGVFRC